MVRKRCDASVQDCIKSCHTKCFHDRPLIEVFGKDLDAALGIVNFETNKKYLVCRYLHQRKIEPALKEIQEENQRNENANPNTMECTDANASTANIQQSTKTLCTRF